MTAPDRPIIGWVAGDAEFTARFPRAGATIIPAVEGLDHLPRIPACWHVVRGHALAVICVQHLDLGLKCFRCSKRHIARHDPAEERRCDECVTGGHDDWTRHALLARPGPSGWHIGDQGGYHRQVDADVYTAVGGWGICRTCHDQAMANEGPK